MRMRFSLHRGRASLFTHALFGASGLTATVGGVSATENAFAMALGAGVDVRVTPRIAVRVIQTDYLLSRLGLAGAKNAN